METPIDGSNCGQRHARLIVWLVGSYLALMVGVLLAFDRSVQASMAASESRLRALEQRSAAREADVRHILESVQRIERHLEQQEGRRQP